MVFTEYSNYSTNKTDGSDIPEILLKVALNSNPNPEKDFKPDICIDEKSYISCFCQI